VLSGAVMDPRGMAELFPDWRARGCPVEAEVRFDCVDWLKSSGGKLRLQGALVPPPLRNHGNHVISLYRVVRWLREQAEALGVDVYPGFAAAEVLYQGRRVVGVQTRDAGIAKDGDKKPGFQPGMNVKAAVTVFAEGTRGNLAKALIADLDLATGRNHQLYETGIRSCGASPRSAASSCWAPSSTPWARRWAPAATAAAGSTAWRRAGSRSATSSAWTSPIPSSIRTRCSSSGSAIRRCAS
jgi:electron-transferring-flavoprotein dehydrogenase